MAIRMEKDPQQEPSRGRNQQSGSGGNLLFRFLPLILMFIVKRPKLILPALLIGGAWFFFFGGKEMLFSSSAPNTLENANFSFGATLNQEKYDQASVFEPLAYGYGNNYNSLPAQVSLEQFAPKRLHQGQQGSCVGWASAYAARTILHAKATGQNPNSVQFSPSYLYNQIALENCQGAYMLDAMKAMSENGSVPFREFGYDERTCGNYPDASTRQLGKQFTIKGYNRLTLGHNRYEPDIMGIKQHLAQGAPVIIGMQVGGTFMNRMMGQDTWNPQRSDYNMRGFGGHAMCLVGYDDNRNGGSFRLMNSWGEDWGNNGLAWVSYKDFQHFTKEAYGLYPMGDAKKADPNKMAVEFGIVNMGTQKLVPLTQPSDLVFTTTQTVNKGDKFKILIANSIECYIYVFGQETNGSSYVLFPYTEKHSPYCGITGTRLFPKDYSMVPDQDGNKDFIAIVISKKEIDFNNFNSRLNASRQSTYAEKLREALGNDRVNQIQFTTGETVAFEAETKTKNTVGMVIEVNKQ